MSGHSKWAKIKRQKGVTDQKRGAVFTKMAKNITLAASEGGADLNTNFNLRLAVDKAKAINMPSDNITRAIKKGTGELGNDKQVARVSYEANGPGGASIIIDCQTDNTNRTVAEIRNILETNNCRMADSGSMSWKFEEKGGITIYPAIRKASTKFGQEDEWVETNIEELELQLFEIEGIDNIEVIEDEDGQKMLGISTEKIQFAAVLNTLKNLELKIDNAELQKLAKDNLTLATNDLDKYSRLVNQLEEHDDVDAIWSDIA